MADEATLEEGSGTGGKSSKKLIIIILAVVLLLAVLGGAGWFFLGGDSDGGQQQADAQQVYKEAIYIKLRTSGGKPSFIVNFQEKTGRQRYLQIYAEAVTREESVADGLRKHMPLVVHELQTLFSSQSFSGLQETSGKQRLRKEATRVVQEVLQKEIGRPGIEEVFFTNFVMQ